MKPTVGRIVYYYYNEEIFEPALITEIMPDGVIWLTIFSRFNSVYKSHVEFSETPKGGCWSWPPKHDNA